MKKWFFIAFLPLCLAAGAQTAEDAAAIREADWQANRIKKGIVLKSARFPDLFDAPQHVNLLIADPSRKGIGVAVAADADSLILTSVFCRQAGAVAGINGTFFDTKNGGSVMLVKVNGKLVNETRRNSEGSRHERSNGAFVLPEEEPGIVQGDQADADWDLDLDFGDVMVSGPVLLVDGDTAALSNSLFNTARHPRSAVAVLPDGRLMLLTADGRNEKAAGMNLRELAFLLETLGAEDAMNLDGGGSTTLWVKGATPGGVVNCPSDNKRFDHEGERAVANVIVVKHTPWLKRLFGKK